MEIGNNHQTIARNTVFLYMRMLVLMLVSLYTTRVLLNVLGFNDYGIFNVVGGLIVMITFISQGLTGAAQRFIMAELAIGNLQSQRIMYTNVVISHIVLCIFVLLLGETVGLWFFSNYLNIPDDRFEAAIWVYQLSLAASITSIMLSPFNAVIVAMEKMSAYAYFSIIDAILKLLIIWILLIVEIDRLILYAFLLVLVGIIDFLIYYIFCRYNFTLCRIVKITGYHQLKDLFGYMGWAVFGLGANVASRQGVTLLVNVYFNVAVNAAIGISNMIVSMASQFVSNFQMAFVPQLTKNYISRNNEELNYLISRSSRYSCFLVLLILVPISIVISELLEIWLGDFPDYTKQFCILSLICIFFDAISNPLTTVITSDKNIVLYQVLISGVYLMDFLICWYTLFLGGLPYYVIVVRAFFCVIGMVVRLWLVKNRLPEFSVDYWLKTVVGRGVLIVFLCIPLLFLRALVIMDVSVWFRFIFLGSVSLIWSVVVVWVMGLTVTERNVVKMKAKNICISKSFF